MEYYDREQKSINVKFGSPLHGELLQDKAAGIRVLRDAMATLYFEMLSAMPVLHRGDINVERLKTEVNKTVTEYPPFDLEYELSCIYYSR